MKCPVEFTVNGKRIEREVEPRTLLVHFLREELGLTGTHIGCETSICGACTILVNGRAAKSCTLLTVQADGSTITTIEGLAPMARDEGLVGENELHPLQEGFRQCHGLQCGFCTPGMILVSKAFLDHNPGAVRGRDSARPGRKLLSLYGLSTYRPIGAIRCIRVG